MTVNELTKIVSDRFANSKTIVSLTFSNGKEAVARIDDRAIYLYDKDGHNVDTIKLDSSNTSKTAQLYSAMLGIIISYIDLDEVDVIGR